MLFMKIAIDFDGTCIDKRYPGMGPDAPHAVEVLKRFIKDGHKIILNTARSGLDLEEAVRWFRKRNIQLYGIGDDPERDKEKGPKVHADAYIDDRSVGCPLMKPINFKNPCVDWITIEVLINKMEI